MVRPLTSEDPRQVGPYALEGRLGGGGMGQVYLGRSRSGRRLAIKLVREQYTADPGFRDRFRREVQLAMKVGGFWSASVVDADPDASVPWVASEYVPGPTLERRVTEQGPLSEPEARLLATSLAEALVSFHAAGVVHRDLKPSNILLTDDGPRVIDFGVSKALESATGLTGTGTVIGTAGFMSPEQAGGTATEYPSDVFSLGSVLVYATTGSGPFGSGSAPALLYRVVHDEPDLTGVPAALCPLVRDCLHKSPDRRPTPTQLLDRLGSLAPRPDAPSTGDAPEDASYEPTTVDPASQPTRTARRTPRGRPVTVPPPPTDAAPPGPQQKAPDGKTERTAGAATIVIGGPDRYARALPRFLVISGLTGLVLGLVAYYMGASTGPVVGSVGAAVVFVGLALSILPQRTHQTLSVGEEGLEIHRSRDVTRVPWTQLSGVAVQDAGNRLTLRVLVDQKATDPAARAALASALPGDQLRIRCLSRREGRTYLATLEQALTEHAPADLLRSW